MGVFLIVYPLWGRPVRSKRLSSGEEEEGRFPELGCNLSGPTPVRGLINFQLKVTSEGPGLLDHPWAQGAGHMHASPVSNGNAGIFCFLGKTMHGGPRVCDS